MANHSSMDRGLRLTLSNNSRIHPTQNGNIVASILGLIASVLVVGIIVLGFADRPRTTIETAGLGSRSLLIPVSETLPNTSSQNPVPGAKPTPNP